MALSWSMRRQSLYYTVGLLLLLAFLWATYEFFFTTIPTCFDGTQNGIERGIDCGGACSLVCSADARSPIVLWARAFEVASGTYAAAAYVGNPNPGVGAKNVRYSFQLFDDKNLLVAEREGVADLSPIAVIPIIEPSINVGNRTVARALFAFSGTPVWQKVETTKTPPLRVGSERLASDGSRLSATVTNDSLQNASRVAVAAVLFDALGVARAVSHSVINVARKSQQEIVFTWPRGTPNVIRAEIIVLPSF